jgi:hypothetical protein
MNMGKIFNTQEVQNILSGNKRMFREVIKKPRHETLQDCIYKGQLKAKGFQVYFENPKARWFGEDMPTGITIKCPYQVGQKIFVKEVFCKSIFGKAIYKDEEKEIRGLGGRDVVVKWKPAQHMKQEHSRLTLQIKEITVERLQDINEEDAIAEGATSRPNCYGYQNRDNGWCMNWSKVGVLSRYSGILKESDICMGSAKYAFANNWNATHKKPEAKFEANPWVWSIQFEVVK